MARVYVRGNYLLGIVEKNVGTLGSMGSINTSSPLTVSSPFSAESTVDWLSLTLDCIPFVLVGLVPALLLEFTPFTEKFTVPVSLMF